MILVKLSVVDTNYEKKDGYTLICTNWEIGTAVETAIKNGFKNINISDPDALEVINYRKELSTDDL